MYKRQMFGLNQTTGIEIPESSPQVSDQDSVRSAIGQGTNNYTTTQLARYVTCLLYTSAEPLRRYGS